MNDPDKGDDIGNNIYKHKNNKLNERLFTYTLKYCLLKKHDFNLLKQHLRTVNYKLRQRSFHWIK